MFISVGAAKSIPRQLSHYLISEYSSEVVHVGVVSAALS